MSRGYDFQGLSASELRDLAQECRERSYKSFERCDTDGFLSQAANDVSARVYDLQASIMEDGGVATFPALFDLDGNQVPAKQIETMYGFSWALLDPENPNGRFLGFFNESKATRKGVARANDAKKGYYVGRVLAPAEADVNGNRAGFWTVVRRTDGGYSKDATIVDNGVGGTDLHVHYDISES